MSGDSLDLGADARPAIGDPEQTYHQHRPADGSYCSCTDPVNNFHGHWPRSCGEHRTCGGRAWCYDCREWCYARPEAGCVGCIAGGADPGEELIRLRGVVARVEALCESWSVEPARSVTTTYASIQAHIRQVMADPP